MSNAKRAFRTTKIRLASFPPEAQGQLEQDFISVEAAKTDAVKAERTAAMYTAQAQIARQRAGIAQVELLSHAADYDNRIAAEQMWLVYKEADGNLVFEGITERLARNNFRAEQQLLGNHLAEQEGHDDQNLYEEDEGDPQ